MLTLLARLFVKGDESQQRAGYGVLCGAYGIVLNLILFTGKILIGLFSSSVSIVADAMNNLSDAGSSIVSVIGFRLSNQKPDLEHPFGHGRVEYLSGLIVAALIVIMGWNLIVESAKRIIHPEETEFSIAVVAVLVLSIIVKLYMSLYNGKIGKKINSQALLATAIDSRSDMLATFTVLVCAVISKLTGLKLDGFAGVAVGIFIGIAGIKAARETVSPLLGQTPDPEFVAEVERIVRSSEAVVGMHDLIVHDYGPGRVMISLHAEVPGNGDIYEMHDAIDTIEYRLNTELNCHAVIHMDPIEVGNPKTDAYREMVLKAVKAIDEKASIHDFRAVFGPTHNNLVFDVLMPMSSKLTDDEVKAEVQRRVSELDNKCFTVITVDRDYSRAK